MASQALPGEAVNKLVEAQLVMGRITPLQFDLFRLRASALPLGLYPTRDIKLQNAFLTTASRFE